MGEDVGDGVAAKVAALGADVVKARAFGQINLDHKVQPRRCRPLFQKGKFGPRL